MNTPAITRVIKRYPATDSSGKACMIDQMQDYERQEFSPGRLVPTGTRYQVRNAEVVVTADPSVMKIVGTGELINLAAGIRDQDNHRSK